MTRADWRYLAFALAVTYVSGVGLGIVLMDQGWL